MTLGDFSQQAETYDLSRPDYPRALVETLASEASVTPGDDVADFGAGTGIFTRLLLELGFNVSAIEPNNAMKQRANLPGATWVDGTFESSKLPAESQSWAVAAQAFHWAQPEAALPEIHRVLRPNGVFTVLWNDRDNENCDVLQWTEEAIRRHVPEFDEAYRARPWGEILQSTGHFESLSHRIQRHTVTMNRERYLNLWRSHNRLNNTAGHERFEAFFTDLSNQLESENINTIGVPYACNAWSVRRVELL